MNLEEIKKSGYELLVNLNKYCEEHNLQYFLSNGTLLGAIKYSGYIPWDDDVDVFLPREDYDKLVRDYVDSDDIKLFAMERQCGYKFPFAKLCDMHTLKQEVYQPIDKSINLGICVDVFPLDDYSNNRIIAKLQAVFIYVKLTLFALSQMDTFKKKNPIKMVIYKMARIIGFDRITKFVLWKPRNNKNESRYIGNRAWAIYGMKEVLPRELFSYAIKAKFEDDEFPIPVGYHEYLSSLYGDYKKDPPADKQVTHHAFKAYKLD